MTSVTFVLRPSTKKPAGRHPGSLILRVIRNRQVKTATMPCRLFPEEWDAKSQLVVYATTVPERYKYLETVSVKIADTQCMVRNFITLLSKQGNYTATAVIEKYRRAQESNKLLGFVEILAHELTKNNQKRLAEAYRTVSRGLVAFNSGQDIPLIAINASLIRDFEHHLRKTNKKPNTVSYYNRNLRAIWHRAVKNKRISDKTEDPFIGSYTKVKTTEKLSLTTEEISKFYEIDYDALLQKYPVGSSGYLNIKNLQYGWQLFFFCFFAQGMCFIDMAHLRKENIKDGVCRYYRHKTNREVVVKVNDGMRQIMDDFVSEVSNSPYVFPIINPDSNNERIQYESALRSQNRRLKALSRLIGMKKKLTTHVARHSFASIVRSGGIPAGVISEMLGHASEKMTHNYFSHFNWSEYEQAYSIICTALSGNTQTVSYSPGDSSFRHSSCLKQTV